MKKFSMIFLSLVVAASITGCGGNTTASGSNEATTASSLKDGTYTATATGIHEGLEVEAIIKEGKIAEVNVKNHNETSGICEPAIERIPAQIVENQTVNVDAVSGASNTSRGILDAVKDIIVQAGGNVEDFSKEIVAEAREEIIIETDFAIVGGGTSGSMAAVSALQEGVEVVVLEKGTSLGGVGKVAHGLMAVESSYQKEAGVDLTSEDIYERMIDYANYRANGKLIKNLLEETSETVDYVVDNFGWTINLSNMNEYNPLPEEYHRVVERNDERWSPVTAKIEELGGKIYYETTGESLIYEDGKVVGVNATMADGTKVTVRAKAVLLATGGAAGNNELMGERAGISEYFLRGSSLSTGDGILMAEEIGAKTSQQLVLETAEIVDNPKANYNQKADTDTRFSYLGGIGLMTVDPEGSRFFNEQRYLEEPLGEGGSAMAYEGNFYTILTQAQLDAFAEKGVYGIIPESVWVPPFYSNKIYGDISAALEEGLANNYIFKADTIEELAQQLDMSCLVDEVETYNTYCADGKDMDFGKRPELLIPVEGEGPFYAFEFTNAVFCSLGGVYTNENLQVRDTSGHIIEGLYATGVDNGSMFSDTYWDVEGVTFSFSLTSGRLAGEHAAQFILENK